MFVFITLLHYDATMHVITINPESLFQALSDTTRLRIIRLLATTGQEICLCELVDSLLLPQYNLSRHLKVLRQTGFLSSQKEGRWVYHRLISEPDYLNQFYNMVRSLPDTDGVYATDLENFNKRIALREEGRCRVGILSSELKVDTE
jgi:ArsR family transcriptional regulator, arsenate/arsenite/antimonite-responsive transcriptional repressor